jgi:hypothetical protein
MTLHGAVIFLKDLSGFELSTFNFEPSTVNFAPVTSHRYLFHPPCCVRESWHIYKGGFF